MTSTLTKSKLRLTKAREPQLREKFWVRKANPELDRAGNWLLENLAAVRAQATSRAHSR
jgi:hypothetical protein